MRVESSSKCSLSSTNTTITQLLKMTMKTSEEVSTRQDVKKTSIIKMLTFLHQHRHYAATENDHGDVGGGEYGPRGGIGVELYYA